jgi:hypothetical protein
LTHVRSFVLGEVIHRPVHVGVLQDGVLEKRCRATVTDDALGGGAKRVRLNVRKGSPTLSSVGVGSVGLGNV